jgi:hypothetical protein
VNKLGIIFFPLKLVTPLHGCPVNDQQFCGELKSDVMVAKHYLTRASHTNALLWFATKQKFISVIKMLSAD